jgi:hypothetical protein
MLADTFNAAGLHFQTLNEGLYPGSEFRYDNASLLIDAHFVDWDFLSLLQDYSLIPVPSAIGDRIIMDGPNDTDVLGAFVVLLVTSGSGWGAVAGTAAANVLYVMAALESHSANAALFGLLGDDKLGYDF